MAIRFVSPDGKLQTVAGHDPKVKGRPAVDVVSSSIASATISSLIVQLTELKAKMKDRIKGLEAENRALRARPVDVSSPRLRELQAKNEKLEAELAALRMNVLRPVTPVTLPVTSSVTPDITPSVTRKRTAAERQRDSRAARKARLADGDGK